MNPTGEATPVARADCVLSVGVTVVPRVHEVAAIPCALVVEVSGETEPPPVTTLQVMSTPAAGLLRPSRTTTASGVASVAPTVSA